jgi:hypothetical protein
MLSQAFSSAVGYAKEIDKSLTNIAIVTGKGAEDMSTILSQAEKTSNILSVQTTDYLDAA